MPCPSFLHAVILAYIAIASGGFRWKANEDRFLDWAAKHLPPLVRPRRIAVVEESYLVRRVAATVLGRLQGFGRQTVHNHTKLGRRMQSIHVYIFFNKSQSHWSVISKPAPFHCSNLSRISAFQPSKIPTCTQVKFLCTWEVHSSISIESPWGSYLKGFDLCFLIWDGEPASCTFRKNAKIIAYFIQWCC